jgi:hypothetical protein
MYDRPFSILDQRAGDHKNRLKRHYQDAICLVCDMADACIVLHYRGKRPEKGKFLELQVTRVVVMSPHEEEREKKEAKIWRSYFVRGGHRSRDKTN